MRSVDARSGVGAAGLLLLLVCAGPGTSSGQCGGDLVSAPGAQVELHFDHQFQGSYRPGEPYDVVTVLPNGRGETLEDVGITLRLRVYCDYNGMDIGPLANVPVSEMVLWSNTLAICSPMTAAEPTDAQGWTEFTGSFRAGGCTDRAQLFIDGVLVATIPIRFNSPDTGSASPLVVDESDLAALAGRLGVPSAYSICFDYNEDGAVDASDVAYFATSLGAACE